MPTSISTPTEAAPVYLRLQEIIRNNTPGYDGILPISLPSWFAGQQEGKYPKPIKLGSRALYRKSDIDDLIARIERGELADHSKRTRARKAAAAKAAVSGGAA